MAKSPSIKILERDMSAYTVTSSDTVLAIVGYATKGPIGVPTLVTSRSEFNEKFGTTVDGSPYAALAAYRAFNQGNQVIFDRVATESTDKDATDVGAIGAEVILKNIAPETAGTMGLDLGIDPIDPVVNTETYSVIITIDGGTPIEAIATAVDVTMAYSIVLSAIQAALVTEGTGATAVLDTDIITITSGTLGTTSSVLIASGGTIADNDLIGTGTDPVATVTAVPGTDSGDSTDNIQLFATELGSSTNLITVLKSSRTNPVTLALVHKVEVYYDGFLKESFDEVSLTLADDTFFKTVINETPDNGGSSFINVGHDDEGTTPLTVDFQDGTYILGAGDDAWATGDDEDFTAYDHVVGRDGFDDAPAIAGANEALFITELAIIGDLANVELFDYHILITPDEGDETVQDAAIALTATRQDFVYVVDPPVGLLYNEVADWHNGIGNHGRTTALDTSYGVLYWSWLKDYNNDTKEYVWCPPSVFIAEKFMEVDRLYGSWYAPAGDLRGRITASDYEQSPSFSQRELLYGDFNAVNPIVNFVSKGLEIYGQKTLVRENTSLNRVNVRRMIIFAKKLIKKALEAIIFEPHNPDSWRRASNLVVQILEPIRQGGGIDQYSVITDETVNTPDVIAQNIMKGTIRIIPTNTIEIIKITMQVDKAGASLEE